MFEFVFVGRTLACPWDGGGRALEHVPGTRVTANGDRIRMELGMTYPAMVSQVCVHAPVAIHDILRRQMIHCDGGDGEKPMPPEVAGSAASIE